MRKTILITTFIAGTLDILAAFIQSYAANNVLPSTVLKYIASGVFGNNAFAGGAEMIAFGLIVHYFIAFACTYCFFWAYPRWTFLRQSVALNSVLIALIAWAVTTRLIVPFSQARHAPFNIVNALIAIGILIVCVGLPIAYFAKRYYVQKSSSYRG
jgi:hypothetical protein